MPLTDTAIRNAKPSKKLVKGIVTLTGFASKLRQFRSMAL
jgi:hypothetical protein